MKHLKHINEMDNWASSNRLGGGDIPQRNVVKQFIKEYTVIIDSGGGVAEFYEQVIKLATRLNLSKADVEEIFQNRELDDIPFASFLLKKALEKYINEHGTEEWVTVDRSFFKPHNESHKEVIPLFHDIFQELKDDGFKVSIGEANVLRLNFAESDAIELSGSERLPKSKFLSDENTLNVVEVKIQKRTTKIHMVYPESDMERFNTEDIMEVLIFAESYIKDVLKYSIENTYVMKVPVYTYYKSLDNMPKNESIDSMSIYFKKD